VTLKTVDEKNKHLFFEAVSTKEPEPTKELAQAASDAT